MSKSSSGPRDCYLAGIAQSPALLSRAHRAQYVIPYEIGGNTFGVERLRLGHAAVDQIAARVFGPGRSDASPANANDGKMPVGVRTRSSALLLRAGIRTSTDCAHSPEWSRDPSLIRNSGALDFGILDDRATSAGGVAARLCRN